MLLEDVLDLGYVDVWRCFASRAQVRVQLLLLCIASIYLLKLSCDQLVSKLVKNDSLVGLNFDL